MPGTWDNMPLLESASGELWGFQAKAGLVHSNQKSAALVSSMGVFLRGAQGEGPGNQGRLLVTRLLGKSYQELNCL